jgi:hypothetical protein
MAGAEIGGDTSVEWDVRAGHVRTTPPPEHRPDGPRGWRQHGKDETGFGALSGFFITLKLPRKAADRATFLTTLCQACADAQAHRDVPGYRVEFTLPIEGRNPTQIRVEWTSKRVKQRVTPRIAFERWLAQKWRKFGPKNAPGKKKAAKNRKNRSVKKARRSARIV